MKSLDKFIDEYENVINVQDTATLATGMSTYLSEEDLRTFKDMLQDEGVDILKHLRGRYETINYINRNVDVIDLENKLFDTFNYELNIPQQNNNARRFAEWIDTMRNKTGFNSISGTSIDASNLIGKIHNLRLIPYLYRTKLFIMLVIGDAKNQTTQLLYPLGDDIINIWPRIGYGLNTRSLELTFQRLQMFLNSFIEMYEEIEHYDIK